MSIKKNNKDHLEGYIPYILGGVVVGAIALNYLSGVNRSFATSSGSEGSGSGSSSSGSGHPRTGTGHHSSSHSSSHPTTHHHTTTAPTHHNNPLTVHHDVHHTTPHTAVHKVTHPDTHKTAHTPQTHSDNDNQGFGFHKAYGFGRGGFGGGSGGNIGSHGGGFGPGGGGMNNFMGNDGARGPPGGPGGGFSHTGEGLNSHGFGHEGSSGGGEHSSHRHGQHQHGHNTSSTTDGKHDHTDSTKGGGKSGHHGGGGKRHKHGGGDLSPTDFKGPRVPPNFKTDDKPPSGGKWIGNKDMKDPQWAHGKKYSNDDKKNNVGLNSSYITDDKQVPPNKDIKTIGPVTGRKITGDAFDLQASSKQGYSDKHHKPGESDRIQCAQGCNNAFPNSETTSYLHVGNYDGGSGKLILSIGGGPQSNDLKGKTVISTGFDFDGNTYREHEGIHKPPHIQHGLDVTGDTVGNIGNIQNRTIGLKSMIYHKADDKNVMHTYVRSYVDANNDGHWKQFYFGKDPHTEGNPSGFTDLSNPFSGGKGWSKVQESRIRVDAHPGTKFDMGRTEIRELDPSKINADGSFAGDDGSGFGGGGGGTSTSRPTLHTNHPAHNFGDHPGVGVVSDDDTSRIGGTYHPTGNVIGAQTPGNISPLATNNVGGGGHRHNIDTSLNRPGAQAPGEAAIQATLGGGFTNFNSNTNTSHSIRPPSTDYASHLTPRQQARHSITGDYFDAVSNELSNAPKPTTQDQFDNNRRQVEYTYGYPSTGGVIGRSNEPLTEDELFSNLAITSGNNNMMEYLAMAALIGIPLALAFNLL